MCKVMDVRVEFAVINLGQNKKKSLEKKCGKSLYFYFLLGDIS